MNNTRTSELLDQIKRLEFKLPIATRDTAWGKVVYSDYMQDEQILGVLKLIYSKSLEFATVLLLSLRSELRRDDLKSKLEGITDEKEIESIVDQATDIYSVLVCTYIRYLFYSAIATAQNAVVLSYFHDEWDSAELSELLEILAEPETSIEPVATL
jgi:hypothetical protein